MPFQSFQSHRWRHGAQLIGEPDHIPDDSLRSALNVRLDRLYGAIEPRPGWTIRTTSALGNIITYLSRLVATAGTRSYAQRGTTLLRLDSEWTTSVSIANPTQVVSDANSPDGSGTLWKYFVDGSVAVKDNGTTSTMGIAPPTALGITVSLAADLTINIDQMDAAASWTGTNLLTGPSDDTSIFQETPSAITYTVAASTFGTLAKLIALQIDVITNGDQLVKQDDYVHLWIRCDQPQRVVYVQIDIDIDAATAVLADAFRRNYYHIRLGSTAFLQQGGFTWTQLQIRKSQFARFGNDTTRSWANTTAYRIGILTNSIGTVTIHVDDLKLRGGVGLEGDISYTMTYRSSVTGARGNPFMNANEIVQFTTPIRTNRQRISINTTNIRQGGANHPGDTQITHWMLWRKGGSFTDPVFVTEEDHANVSPALDNFSDATVVLSSRLFETDNDLPPTGATRVLFGPGGGGHFFMIVDGYRLYFSKGYERGENRVENWGRNNFAIVSDGSSRAVAGLASSSQVRVWTTERTLNIIGIGQDTFLPVPIEGSHGCVGQFAVTSGDNAIYFVSQDGIYADVGGRQIKLTGAIDPFFQGRTIDGQTGWNAVYASSAVLEFLNEATGSALVMLYTDISASVPSKYLVLKPNPDTGQLTECFFCDSALTNLRSLFFDAQNRELLAGGTNGHVYRIEDPNRYHDNGTAIVIRARTKSFDLDQPQHAKYLATVAAEGHTSSQNVALTAYYDRNTLSELLGDINTSSEVGQTVVQTNVPETPRRDIAMEITGSFDVRVAITRLLFHYEPQPELHQFLDSGVFAFDFVQQLKRFELDITLPSITTITVYAEGVQVYQAAIPSTVGRQNFPYPFPAGMRGRLWRITLLTTGDPLRCYRISGFFKQLGTDQAYTERVIVAPI